jgi:hypothetical protein
LLLVNAAPNGPVDVMVRPEQIRFARLSSADAPRASVLSVTYYGHDTSVVVALQPSAETLACGVPGRRSPEPGAEARMSVEGAVMAYPRANSGPDAVSGEASAPLGSPQFRSTGMSAPSLGHRRVHLRLATTRSSDTGGP